MGEIKFIVGVLDHVLLGQMSLHECTCMGVIKVFKIRTVPALALVQ